MNTNVCQLLKVHHWHITLNGIHSSKRTTLQSNLINLIGYIKLEYYRCH